MYRLLWALNGFLEKVLLLLFAEGKGESYFQPTGMGVTGYYHYWVYKNQDNKTISQYIIPTLPIIMASNYEIKHFKNIVTDIALEWWFM